MGATLKTSAPWLQLNPTLGTTPYTTQVSVNPSGLAAGTYTATIGVASTTEPICNPQEIESVSLTIVVSKPERTKPGKGPRK